MRIEEELKEVYKMKKRIKWNNVLGTILFILCLCLVLTDLFYILIYPIITTDVTSWTWFGIFTFSFSLAYVLWFIEYFIGEVK